MKKILVMLLILSIFPMSSALGDRWDLIFSDGTTTINGTDVCLDNGVCLASVVANASGDITEVNTPDKYLSGGATSGPVTLLLNETELNATITAIGGSGGNASFNQSLTDSLYISQLEEGNLNVNSSDYWDTYDTANTTWFQNIGGVLSIKLSELTSFINTWFATENATIARTGDCPSGQFVQNSTTGGVECAAAAGSGDITSVEGDDIYIYNGSASGDVLLVFNETKLNLTGDARYAPINYGDDWNKTYADTLYADISVIGDNSSWNQSLADTLYIASESDPLSLHLSQDNWFNDTDGYIYWEGGDTIMFNQTKLETQFFNATTVDPVTGTPAGTITDLQTYNSISYNLSEVTSDIELIVNFTGIVEFNQLIIRYKSDASESHSMIVQIWNYDVSGWEEYITIGNTENVYNIITTTVFDSDEHISGGVVQVRFYSNNLGGSTHLHQFDWVSISNGPATPSDTETDPFAIHKDGMVSFEANWDQGAFNITNTNSWFFGLINWSTIQNKFFGSTTDDLTEGSSNFYDNQSWNQSAGNLLYADISIDGTLTSVIAGDGMDFSSIITTGTVTMGTPGTLNGGTANSLSATSHLHAVTTDDTGVCGAGNICGGGHEHPASEITTGTFGTGNYVMDTNLTVEKIVFENSASHFMEDNSTCVKIYGSTSILEIC